MTTKTLATIALVAALGASATPTVTQAQSSRDYIAVVGSSTVYPFTTTVAEQFGKGGKFKTPKVESTGTGGGFKLFCSGVGVQYPDISNASRAIKASEVETCAKNGVKDIIEVKVGYDGIVLANSKKASLYKVTRREVFLALAKNVPDPANPTALVPNPYKTWNQINKALPADKIEVLGPPPTSGTRDAFVELVMEEGCQSFSWIKTLKGVDEARFKRVCDSVREDGAYVEAGENDNLIVQKLEANPKALGIFGFSFLEENVSRVEGSFIDGVEPTFDNIASGKYPVSRPLFIYAKKAHMGVIPGLREFLAEYVSDRSMGTEGYLADKGLIPLSPAEAGKVRAGTLAKAK
ncbi:MAG: PstS family phosphate ABC transporter substrate-binding protein [Proteobacteria bacterium]|nr:PstS family phosphate ABC transporter substrate-binding protein [Pseudomonadota bacterium]MBK9251034.1 PstS family phosphate ABC transporter substrate-binding protein [Pseudomonadota bacterium]